MTPRKTGTRQPGRWCSSRDRDCRLGRGGRRGQPSQLARVQAMGACHCHLYSGSYHVGRNMAPTMSAPGIATIEADLHIGSSVASTLAVTLYVLGIVIGPMFMSPLSEIYGRVPVYHAANIMFVAFIRWQCIKPEPRPVSRLPVLLRLRWWYPDGSWRWDDCRYYDHPETSGGNGVV
ncbi:uncharacterized protein BDV17DRAFT_275149 [Aspergillus undulatus]|uniref:uncharacterized protein n=1 Tax=Aspergillus undulatus TaxID=1810928 RepID=UPI003CCE2BB7